MPKTVYAVQTELTTGGKNYSSTEETNAYPTEDEAVITAINTFEDLRKELKTRHSTDPEYSAWVTVRVVITQASEEENAEFCCRFENTELWYDRETFARDSMECPVEVFDYDTSEEEA